MSAEKLRKFIDGNRNLFGWEDTLLLNGVCNELNDYEQQGAKITITGDVIPATQPEATTQFDKQVDEAITLVDKCFRSAWDVAFSRTGKDEKAYTAAVKLTEIMVNYIQRNQRIDVVSSMSDLAKELLKPKLDNIPFPESVYKQHEEKLINSDDFLNEKPVETIDITNSSVGILQKALIDESGGAISMEVLCRDHLGNLKKVTGVHQVLFVKSMLDDDRFVLRVVTEARAGEPIPDIGLLIS